MVFLFRPLQTFHSGFRFCSVSVNTSLAGTDDAMSAVSVSAIKVVYDKLFVRTFTHTNRRVAGKGDRNPQRPTKEQNSSDRNCCCPEAQQCATDEQVSNSRESK